MGTSKRNTVSPRTERNPNAKGDKIIEDQKILHKRRTSEQANAIDKRKAPPKTTKKRKISKLQRYRNLIMRYETEENAKDRQEIIRESQCPT